MNAALVCATLAAAAAIAVAVSAASARAETTPPPGTPATVSADPLPTVQQDGVVWAEVTVGNTVYATGSFSETWLAGSTNTPANDTARANLLAFDITTGQLIQSFNHSLNAQGLTITASPDGSVVYVGGDFTAVDGITRNHIAAFSTATGDLLSSFAPSIGNEVDTITATNSTVYVGGNFFNVNGVARTRLAALNAVYGQLLSWAPTADDQMVTAMVVTPDQSEVVIGGRFLDLNGVATYGLGAVDSVTGASVPYAANQYIRDYSTDGAGAGIDSLTTDGTQIYGSGFSFYTGNFEGTFGLDPDSGQINFINDCHGDTYSVQPVGQVLYEVGHAHDCSAIGDFPDTSPRILHHALAFSNYPTGTNGGPDSYGWNYKGLPDSTLLHWYPALTIGSVTGQNQAAWSVTGNSSYIALGGEFPKANGVAQQGLVRYAITSVAPNKVGPTGMSGINPSIVSLYAGTVRLAWQGTWDQDNENLTYNVLRDGDKTPIYTTTQASTFWQLPAMGFVDTGLTPGSTHTYRVQVVDPLGNKISSPTSDPVTVSAAAPPSNYVNAVVADGAGELWPLNEPSGTTGYDWAGFSDLTEGTGVTDGAGGPLLNDGATAATFNGTSAGTASTTAPIQGPNTFSIEAWIKTTTSGGKIVGFGNTKAGSTSSSVDRHVYMDNSGHLVFGVYNGTTYTITSSARYNDGAWHYVVAELSGAGMDLFVDGKLIGQNQGTTVGGSYTGYWRVGGDNLNSWPSKPSSPYFRGTIADVAIYPSALTIQQVQSHYTASGRTLATPPPPTDGYGSAIYQDNPEMYWRLDEASGKTAADATPYADTGTYSGGVTFQTASPVTGANGTGATLDGKSGLIVSSQAFTNPSIYSEELWFKTTTSNGGKLIGFGNATSGLSSSYDRHVYMLNSGQLEFGTSNGQQITIVSPRSYDDGAWHYLVATQGPDGMTLYVDGHPVGTNPATKAGNYTGYWRVGGDRTWGGATSNYFAGSIDEAAVYPRELTAAQVLSHYEASPAAVNPPPSASFTQNCTYLACSFDASGSSDLNGKITDYSWDFDDGSATANDVTPAHTYATAGSYKVALTVTDSFGHSATTTSNVTVVAPPPPIARFSENCNALSCSFDATASSDAGGTITNYAWDFGDGGNASGTQPGHSYAAPGSYPVTLTLTDSNNQTASVTQTVTVTGPQPPVAAFTPTCTYLACGFDASASTDPNGTITGYSWQFGDGGTAIGRSPAYTYASADSYQVTLTVTDSNNLTDTITQTVTVSAPPPPPVAAFTPTCTNLACSFDASTSSDPSGATITSYAWTFGDGNPGTGQTASNTYQAAGDYTVTLTVTDSNNLTDTVTQVVSPRPATNPPIPLYASDNFNRTVSNGWGTAPTGGAWSAQGGGTSISVANGVGLLTMSAPGAGPGAYLGSVSSTDSSTLATLTTNAAATGNGIYVDIIGRRISSNTDYRGRILIKANNTVAIALIANDAGTATTIKAAYTLPGVTYAPGMVLNAELEVTGTSPTTVGFKVWPAGAAQPAGWQITATDSNAHLQAPGAVGIASFLTNSSTVAPVAVQVSSFTSGPSAGLPSGAFTATCSGQQCTTDASAATDPSGVISSYQWSWGDGTVTTGVTSQHSYAQPGTYRITLTVTDPSGWTSVVMRSVTVPV